MLNRNNRASYVVDESNLINNLRSSMQRANSNERYCDAIFFADKILHLISTKQENDFIRAVYDLAKCYLLNKEYLRCIELLEKYAKHQSSL
jgi:hypothetical protein